MDWASVSKDWKSAAKEMITNTFSQQYLEPKEPAYATRQ
jgi:hypothetical protein